MNDIVNALVALLVITLICAVGIIIVGSFMTDAIIQKIEGTEKRQEKNSVHIRELIMELINKIKICDTRLVTIQQMLNSKVAEKKSTEQEVGKMSYKVKPNKHEITIDFVFEHDGEEYNFKVVERDARQAILDEFVKPESREAVDKFLKENDLWDETLSKLDTFLNEHFEEEFHREVRKW